MKQHLKILFLFSLFSLVANAQQNSIAIQATLSVETDELFIQQEIIFHNTSDSTFTKVYLHNWPNSFRDRKTPLSKRFVEDFRKDLYFADKEELGFSSMLFKDRSEKPTLVATKSVTGFLGFAAAATEIALAAMSVRENKRVPSLIVGESFLKNEFPFSGESNQSEPNRVILVNHFASGISNHSFVLRSLEDSSV